MKQWNPVHVFTPILIFIISLTAPIYASSLRRTPEVESALNWLKGQFEPSTALPQSYENHRDAAAWTYDVATWIIVMTQADEIESAQQVVQTMLQLQSNGAWVDGYSIINRSPITAAKSVGPNTWMGLALCHYFQATNENEALEGALRVADWLIGLQNVIPKQSRSDGAIPGGLDESGAQIQWISVEHNTDALAFFYALSQITAEKKYSDAAQRIANWLVGQMWNQAESHFEVGTVDLAGTVNKAFPERLDTQTWTILGIDATKSLTGLEAKDFNGLPWIGQYETMVQYQGKTVKGFAIKTFGPGSQSFWSEGTAGYGLAAMTIGDAEAATFYSGQIHRLQTQNGGIPHSVAPDDVPQAYPQKWDFNSIAATTWMIWVDSRINPFRVAGENHMTTHLLIVTGTVYEADGKTVVSEKLSVTVQNTNNQMKKSDETGRYAGSGQYIVTFLSLDNRAADVDDVLEITANSGDGKQIVQEQHTLTPTEIQESFVQIDLTLAPAPPPWDVNADGVVNVFDLVIVGSQLGKPGADPKADVNSDGLVNIFDLVLVAAHFGENAAAPPLADVSQATRLPASNHEQIRTALAELEGLVHSPRGAEVAIEFLRAWLASGNAIVTETKLLPNYPNPLNPETWMPYQLASASEVTLRIYDLSGKPVRQLVLGEQPAGLYLSRERAAYWDGRNDFGESVTSGVYFYSLTTNPRQVLDRSRSGGRGQPITETRKMLILK